MKKQGLLLALLLASVLRTSAQTTPWFQIGNEWTYEMYFGWNPVYGLHRMIIIDEVILSDNKMWTRFRRYHPDGGNNLFYYARQEGEKIYSWTGGPDMCIYDFALQPGDTLFLYAPWNYYTVQDTGSAFMAGRLRRTQTIRFAGPMYQQAPLLLVEGIGPVGNPQEPANPGFCSFFFLNHSFCHAPVDGMSAYFRCFANADGVYAPFAGCLVGSSEAESPDDAIRVWPNPAHERLFVQGSFRTVELFDTYGRLVMTETTLPDGQAEIQIGHLPDGVYWLHCQTERGALTVRKVVVAR